MIGVAEPLPGIFTFHFTLLVSLQVTGGDASGAVPFWSGPRHCGQFLSCSEPRAIATVTKRLEMPTPSRIGQGRRTGRERFISLLTTRGSGRLRDAFIIWRWGGFDGGTL